MIEIKEWEKYRSELEKVNVHLPKREDELRKGKGEKNPRWIHFGGGNLYRGFHAEIAQNLFDKGQLDAGVIVCETFDPEIISSIYRPYNNNLLEVVMHQDGQLEKRLLTATAGSFYCHPSSELEYEKVGKYFESNSLQFVTLTITEKGYGLKDQTGSFLPIVQADIEQGPSHPQHTMSILAALLHKRFLAGASPLALVSTDNFSRNGSRFKESILEIVEAWVKKGFVSEKFKAYVDDEAKVSFPWTMIDRITPNPSKATSEELKKMGFSDMKVIQTKKGTNIALFANTEVVNYLVIEDHFPNGRPALEAAGVIMTDRETVDRIDTMKVTTCLNPLHTALAIFGCLMDYSSISSEMEDGGLVSLIEQIGYHEGLPVIKDPKLIDAKTFIDEVIQLRLPNPSIPDTPQRIATDTSQKIGIRFGQTIKEYIRQGKTNQLTYIPLTIAGWLRYLIGLNDEGESMVLSPDPLLSELQDSLSEIKLGEQNPLLIHEAVYPILSNRQIFGVDLYEAALGEKIESNFLSLLAGPGAVRKTIDQYKKVQEKTGGKV